MPASIKSMVPFAEGKRSEEFGRALLQKMVRRVSELREELMPPENVGNMPHGHGWTFQQQREEGFFPERGEFEKHSTEYSIHNDRILSNDLGVVEDLIVNLAQQIHDDFVKHMLQEIDETCTRFDRVTNIPKGASIADGILSSIASIHASVNADGSVSFPMMTPLSPDLIERLKSELQVRGEEVQRKAAEIRAQSEKDAREREAERLAKYESQ